MTRKEVHTCTYTFDQKEEISLIKCTKDFKNKLKIKFGSVVSVRVIAKFIYKTNYSPFHTTEVTKIHLKFHPNYEKKVKKFLKENYNINL